MTINAKPRICLLVLDGAGYKADFAGNAVRPDSMPEFFSAMNSHGVGVLGAAGESVGLEAGQVGNSEAGHLTIGAGHIVPCLTKRITHAFDSGAWAKSPGWKTALAAERLHIVGLASDAGVHGLARTIVQAVQSAKSAGVRQIVVHPVLDGIDSPAGSAPAILGELVDALKGESGVRLGVIQGRRQFCDRSGNMALPAACVRALQGRDGLPTFATSSLQEHLAGASTEADFPAHLYADGLAIAPGDPVLITSHRADRARQMARTLSSSQPLLMIVDPGKEISCEHIFFPQAVLDKNLAHVLKRAQIKSVRIAERCKFPHVTHFFNGFDAGLEGHGVCIDSIPETEIPEHPEMSLEAITGRIIECLDDPQARVVIANLANLDQVGHLGNMQLAVQAAQLVDQAFARIAERAAFHGWTLLVTADHGNADQVETSQGKPFGSHTTCPVPFVVLPPPGASFRWSSQTGTLANVAPTCLAALGLETPAWMESPMGSFSHALHELPGH